MLSSSEVERHTNKCIYLYIYIYLWAYVYICTYIHTNINIHICNIYFETYIHIYISQIRKRMTLFDKKEIYKFKIYPDNCENEGNGL